MPFSSLGLFDRNTSRELQPSRNTYNYELKALSQAVKDKVPLSWKTEDEPELQQMALLERNKRRTNIAILILLFLVNFPLKWGNIYMPN